MNKFCSISGVLLSFQGVYLNNMNKHSLKYITLCCILIVKEKRGFSCPIIGDDTADT